MNKQLLHVTALFVIALIMSGGCKARRTADRSALAPMDKSAIIEMAKANRCYFNTLNAKLSTKISSPNKNISSKANLRMAYDSIIWMSITPALGIEAFRAVVTPDSIKLLDKLNSKYYIGNYSILDSLLSFEPDFYLLQDILLGNPNKSDHADKFRSIADKEYYALQSITNSVSENENPEGKDNLVKTYFFRPEDFRLGKLIIEDPVLNRSISVVYHNYAEVEDVHLPMSIAVQISSSGSTAGFELEYNRISTNESQTYPFKIPEKYAPFK